MILSSLDLINQKVILSPMEHGNRDTAATNMKKMIVLFILRVL